MEDYILAQYLSGSSIKPSETAGRNWLVTKKQQAFLTMPSLCEAKLTRRPMCCLKVSLESNLASKIPRSSHQLRFLLSLRGIWIRRYEDHLGPKLVSTTKTPLAWRVYLPGRGDLQTMKGSRLQGSYHGSCSFAQQIRPPTTQMN